MQDQIDAKNIKEEDLKQGAKEFETFWIRPKKMTGREAILRIKVNKKWGGWKLKDELVTSLGLEVGDTINTEITVLEGPGLIDEMDTTDLFASGKGADWLLDNCVSKGSIIDAKVKFFYTSVPVGREDKVIWKVSLVFVEGYNIIKERDKQDELPPSTRSTTMEMLKSLLEQ